MIDRKCARLDCTAADLYEPPPTSGQPYRPVLDGHALLRAEVVRRATLPVTWVRDPVIVWRLPIDEQLQAKELREAVIETRVDAWLDGRPCELQDQEAKIRAYFDAPSTPDRTAARPQPSTLLDAIRRRLEALNQPTAPAALASSRGLAERESACEPLAICEPRCSAHAT